MGSSAPVAHTYSVTGGARLLGVSVATLSRRLPAERATRGRRARLSLQELMEVAPRLGVDPEDVVERVEQRDAFGADMPAEAHRWARLATERGLATALAVHMARIADSPGDLQGESGTDAQQAAADVELFPPWGAAADWTPIVSSAQLEQLIPAAGE